MKRLWSVFFVAFIIATGLLVHAHNDDEELDDSEFDHDVNEVVRPLFTVPTIEQDEAYFVEWFANTGVIGKTWHKSSAKKEGVNEEIAKYNGEWSIRTPSKVIVENDFGLVVETRARHHAIASSLTKPFVFDGKPLIVQYEVKYENGQECGGGYVKLLSKGAEKAISTFNDKTKYSIMFGPDKCGQNARVHFIVNIKNPINGTIGEHQAKETSQALASFFEDKKTHLYTLKITSDNTYTVYVDNSVIVSGNLLTDMNPPIEPPVEIVDPTDEKPADWDEREQIQDPDATKPEDWDETQPQQIIDQNAVKPADWLEDEEALIPDSEAKKPEDWDTEMDGEWEPPLKANPACASVSGCGKWTAPLIANPLYRGKWSPPLIKNPDYKGKWTPKLIANPNHYKPNPYTQLESITAIGFELWTMSDGIIFDNIIIADDENVVHRFAAETFTIKKTTEDALTASSSSIKNMFQGLIDATEEKPWLWAVYVLTLLIPTVLISVLCFGRKTTAVKEKIDIPVDDFLDGDENDEQPDDDEAADNEPAQDDVLTESGGEKSANGSAAGSAVSSASNSPGRHVRQRPRKD